MPHIVLCHCCDLCLIILPIFRDGHGISGFQSCQGSRFLTDHRTLIRQLILLFRLSVLKRNILLKILQILRYMDINTDIGFISRHSHLRKLHMGIPVNLIIIRQKCSQFFSFFLRGILIINDRSRIMLQIPVLPLCNIHNRIPDSKSNQHQCHTTRNSKHCHKQTFLITEKISQCGFPRKAQMLPEKRYPLHQNPLTLFRCRRTHQRCRCLRQCLIAGEDRCTNRTYRSCPRCDHGKFKFIVNLHIVGHALVHDSISIDYNIRKDFFSDQDSQNASTHCSQQRIQQILRSNRIFSISQCLHGTDLCSLFLNHSRHGRQTYQCRNQEKDHRKYLTDILQTLRIITIIRILRKIITIRHYPLRFSDIINLLLRIRNLLLSVCDFFLSIRLSSLIFFPAILQIFLGLLDILSGILQLLLILCNLFLAICQLLLIRRNLFLTIHQLLFIRRNLLLAGSDLRFICRNLLRTGSNLRFIRLNLCFPVCQLSFFFLNLRLTGTQLLFRSLNLFLCLRKLCFFLLNLCSGRFQFLFLCLNLLPAGVNLRLRLRQCCLLLIQLILLFLKLRKTALYLA